MTTTLRDDIKAALMQQRKLTPATCTAYSSCILSLFKKAKVTHLSEFEDKMKTMVDIIADMKSVQSQKTLCSALFVMTADPQFREMMMGYINVSKEDYAKRVDTPARAKVRIPFSKVEEITQYYIDHADDSYDALMNAMIAMLCSGVYQAPRRLEYVDMKMHNFDKNEDNFIQGNVFVFNDYKTAKVYKQQRVDIHPEVMKMVRYIKKNVDSDYLLSLRDGSCMSKSTLNARLKKMYGFGVDMLRSIYISDRLYDNNLQQRLETAAHDMGNSVGAQSTFYIKDK
jgi:hypothetical protein